MKKFAILLLAGLLSSAFAMSEGGEAAPANSENCEPEAITSGSEVTGFLTTPECLERTSFTNCKLETFVCGSIGCYKNSAPAKEGEAADIVLYNHDENKVYKIDYSKLKRSELDEGVARNGVTIIGEIDPETNTIVATGFKAPPPPKKSFFKGCL